MLDKWLPLRKSGHRGARYFESTYPRVPGEKNGSLPLEVMMILIVTQMIMNAYRHKCT